MFLSSESEIRKHLSSSNHLLSNFRNFLRYYFSFSFFWPVGKHWNTYRTDCCECKRETNQQKYIQWSARVQLLSITKEVKHTAETLLDKMMRISIVWVVTSSIFVRLLFEPKADPGRLLVTTNRSANENVAKSNVVKCFTGMIGWHIVHEVR